MRADDFEWVEEERTKAEAARARPQKGRGSVRIDRHNFQGHVSAVSTPKEARIGAFFSIFRYQKIQEETKPLMCLVF